MAACGQRGTAPSYAGARRRAYNSAPMPAAAYRFGPFLVDRAGYRVLRGGEVVDLTPKLLDLLLHLVDRPGTLVTKDELLEALWPDANVTENALAQAMSELRQALGDNAGSPQFIKTVARRGYRFIAPVENIESAAHIERGEAAGARAAPAGDRSIASPGKRDADDERTIARAFTHRPRARLARRRIDRGRERRAGGRGPRPRRARARAAGRSGAGSRRAAGGRPPRGRRGRLASRRAGYGAAGVCGVDAARGAASR